MSFCSNCGTKAQEGDTFCAGCGSSLESINSNSNENTQTQNFKKPSVVVVVPSINTEAVSKHLKQTLAIVLNMLTKPASTIKDLVHTLDQKSIIILGIVLALIQGIFSFWKLNQVLSLIGKTIATLTSSMGGLMGSMLGGGSDLFGSNELLNIAIGYNEVKDAIKIPYFNAFLHGVILYVVIVGVMFLGIFVASKVFSKDKINEMSAVKLIILATIPVLGGEFSNIILSYLSSSLGFFALLIGILVSFILVILNIKELVAIEDDKLVYGLAVVFSVLTVCVLFATWKFVLSDMNTIAKSLNMM